jgi:hypothetical protein
MEGEGMTFYRVISASGENQIKKEVEEALKHGWICQGGISMSITFDRKDNYHEQFSQAMIKIKTER